MTRRIRASAIAVAALIAAGALAIAGGNSGSPESLPARAPAERPTLMLLTSLPLVFGERFGLEEGGSPVLSALERRYRVVPISVANGASLSIGRLLLMAQPQAQPAEVLVELDAWVRRGGRVLLLADPALEWHSERPLGDPLRPAPTFADTGLLAHWGLTLTAPEGRGPKLLHLGDREVVTNSPGSLSGRACQIGKEGLIATCKIGAGRATIIADADFLDVGRPEGLDGPTDENLPALLTELAALERR